MANTTPTAQPTIVFYDIASGPPVRPYAPNPWKTRYALNFKGVDYRTEWVELPDVTSLRKSLGVAASRQFPDGSDYFTLPIIKNTTNGTFVGDSFDIAVYLDKTYPNKPTLIPDSTIGLHTAFNAQVDALFSQHGLLFGHGLPFNPATAQQSKDLFVERMKKINPNITSWDDLTVRGEERVKALKALELALGQFAKVYKKREEGPFLEGKTVTYADLIVGAWLCFFKVTVPEWDQIQTWQDGLWGKLDKALSEFATVQ
eukprot:TRINITY_DN795_c0_g1_i3.p1 TRINITY_DN795_c0_g1~~TRINITY_DN795_c0_g1_i3.p1  ORF type:complete len:258 (-),score=52.15 TRINITY_DN795_c0_g1_i3:47-820(-)